MGLRTLFQPRPPASVDLDFGGRAITVAVRVSDRAKNYRLSISPRHGPVLTVPRLGRWRDAEAFLSRHAGWLDARLESTGEAPRIAHGAIIPLRGEDHRIIALDRARGLVTPTRGIEGAELHVPGGEAHCRRRLIDWLKTEARADLEAACAIHAGTLGVKVAAISLRDQSSRWGSCSSARRLNFNWRLVMAPPFVLDYVAAHEVAHILEMNHAPVFWRTVGRALPDYEKGRRWLKANGQQLMRIG
ncbi:M48 family metallopeptidase [Pelagibacterium limicola]|uniref:M48 family metallopeptidase n=1 Tax=Pelagibacterium limicola TaxID=2791022 RepID=UPI0018AF6814|nr:SprT family zinc-dependent metalloprotease [Pelagibacterium limicola]